LFYPVMTLYIQFGLAFRPFRSGTAVLPLAIGFALTPGIVGRRAQRRGIVRCCKDFALRL
jgi:hypothetical protein